MIDTHAHLDACAEPAGALLDRARAAGVDRVVAVGSGIDSCRASLAINICFLLQHSGMSEAPAVDARRPVATVVGMVADGMTEEIVTGLSRFSYLRVIALGSTARYANQAVDIRSAGKELGARYVMEGSLRQAGARLRVAVQLVEVAVRPARLLTPAAFSAASSGGRMELQ